MKIKTILGLIVFLGFPFLMKLFSLDLVLHEVFMWLLFLFIILWIYFGEKQTIVSIGWKKLTVKTALWGVGIGVVFFIIFGILNVTVQAMGLELNQELAKMFASQPLPFLFLIVLRAGVVEEVLYRAYAYERLYDITKSKFIAGIIPVILFTMVHLAWGVGHLLFVFIVGGLFMIMYIKKRNLLLNIIAHFTVDVIVILVLPMLVASQ